MPMVSAAERLAALARTLDSAAMVPSTQVAGSGTGHPDLATHDALGLATDAELTTHAATAHGLSSHAVDGAFHSNIGLLPTQGQRNALAGTSGTPGTGNEYVTTQDARNMNARTPTLHSHAPSEVTGTAVVTADARLSDPRTPLAHTHAPVYALLANGAVAMALGTNDAVKVTPTATATYTTTVPAAGKHVHVLILTAGAVSFTITFGAGFKPSATLATGTVAARIFVLEFVSDGTNLYEVSRTAALVA